MSDFKNIARAIGTALTRFNTVQSNMLQMKASEEQQKINKLDALIQARRQMKDKMELYDLPLQQQKNELEVTEQQQKRRREYLDMGYDIDNPPLNKETGKAYTPYEWEEHLKIQHAVGLQNAKTEEQMRLLAPKVFPGQDYGSLSDYQRSLLFNELKRLGSDNITLSTGQTTDVIDTITGAQAKTASAHTKFVGLKTNSNTDSQLVDDAARNTIAALTNEYIYTKAFRNSALTSEKGLSAAYQQTLMDMLGNQDQALWEMTRNQNYLSEHSRGVLEDLTKGGWFDPDKYQERRRQQQQPAPQKQDQQPAPKDSSGYNPWE